MPLAGNFSKVWCLMRISAVLVLGCTTVLLSLFACGRVVAPSPTAPEQSPDNGVANMQEVQTSAPETTPTLDIEAIIQDRLEAILSSTRTPTPVATMIAPDVAPSIERAAGTDDMTGISPTVEEKSSVSPIIDLGGSISPQGVATPMSPVVTNEPTINPTPTPTITPTVTPTPTRVASLDPTALPPFPNIYRGNVFVGGTAAPDGTLVFARIDVYSTPSVAVKDGRYRNLTLGPPGAKYYGRGIAFYAIIDGVERLAEENSVFQMANLATRLHLFNTLDLHF